ncbi:hypothetical protein B0H16DRAFT_1687954 [Mycena metata]|uniref:Uncharacterized protein n=1 Tax=Mycena metata TaxID=1033252 RepID=A0AAD7NJ95_9AGAR|nr:hypothetical protein B0H16DRAFT_1687954 [Mycena metata]
MPNVWPNVRRTHPGPRNINAQALGHPAEDAEEQRQDAIAFVSHLWIWIGEWRRRDAGRVVLSDGGQIALFGAALSSGRRTRAAGSGYPGLTARLSSKRTVCRISTSPFFAYASGRRFSSERACDRQQWRIPAYSLDGVEQGGAEFLPPSVGRLVVSSDLACPAETRTAPHLLPVRRRCDAVCSGQALLRLIYLLLCIPTMTAKFMHRDPYFLLRGGPCRALWRGNPEDARRSRESEELTGRWSGTGAAEEAGAGAGAPKDRRPRGGQRGPRWTGTRDAEVQPRWRCHVALFLGGGVADCGSKAPRAPSPPSAPVSIVPAASAMRPAVLVFVFPLCIRCALLMTSVLLHRRSRKSMQLDVATWGAVVLSGRGMEDDPPVGLE